MWLVAKQIQPFDNYIIIFVYCPKYHSETSYGLFKLRVFCAKGSKFSTTSVSPTLIFFLFSSLMMMHLIVKTYYIPCRTTCSWGFCVISRCTTTTTMNHDFTSSAHLSYICTINPESTRPIDWRIMHLILTG